MYLSTAVTTTLQCYSLILCAFLLVGANSGTVLQVFEVLWHLHWRSETQKQKPSRQYSARRFSLSSSPCGLWVGAQRPCSHGYISGKWFTFFLPFHTRLYFSGLVVGVIICFPHFVFFNTNYKYNFVISF